MKRRKFLLVSLFGLLISLIAVWLYKIKTSVKRDLMPSDLAGICDKNTLIKLGNTYRIQTGENNREYLEELLLDDSELRDREIHIFLNNKVTEDFDKGNTILIEGWLLSVTEARQCALFSLLETN
jgi:hypothetical protein